MIHQLEMDFFFKNCSQASILKKNIISELNSLWLLLPYAKYLLLLIFHFLLAISDREALMIYQLAMFFSEELQSGFYLKKIYHFRTQLIVAVTVIITSLCKICYHYLFYFLLAISDREAVIIYRMEMTS